MTNQPNREVAVFSAVRRLPSGQRTAYLDKACAGDATLRQRVEELLRAHEQAEDFLESPPAGLDFKRTVQVDIPLTEKAGDRIGRYKLLQQIGEGGCGVVYMAEQEEPVRRRVALKVIKLGMDTKSVIARFEAERQALALMDHPNIAKVLDAGATDTGRPFFVMELVRGIKITDYCDQNNLSIRERLDLFIQVCRAIQHAHQKGIIHRDIKPSNILVTVNDGVAVPKVIDFGIAKATQGRLTDKTLFTAFEQFIGTPAYMSPEQAVMTSLDIDTRSDIYALGVLLYELLTGKTPFDASELLESGLDAMRRTIREVEPPKPSARLSTILDGERATTASQRQTEPPKLIHLLKGDLDWIVMKCLEKDRARRYGTANGLAADIQRHLNTEPVVACPPSNLYRFQKLARRNKLAFTAVSAVAVALVLGVVASTAEAIRATRAQREQTRLRETAQKAQENEARMREQAESRAYASDMSLAAQTANSGLSLGSVNQILERWRETKPDRRGWEWYYLNGLCHRDILTINADSNGLLSVAWSPDGKRLASGGRDSTVKIWNASTGHKITELRGHTDMVQSVAWSPDGRKLASGSSDRTIKVWDANAANEVVTLNGHLDEVRCVAWSRDGKKLASASSDRTIKIWDSASGLELHSWPIQAPGWCVRWNSDGTRLACCSNFRTKILDAETGVKTLELPQGVALDWSPDDTGLAIGGYSGQVVVWNPITGQNVAATAAHEAAVTSLAWSPDGTRLASVSRGDGTVAICDARSGNEIQSFHGHAGSASSVAWRPDGAQVATVGTHDGTIKVWDVNSADRTVVKLHQPTQVLSLSWRPNGKQLASGGRSDVYIWNTTNDAQPVVLRGHTDYVWSEAWSADGTRLASGAGDGTIRLWDVTSAREIWRAQAAESLQGYPSGVRSLAWSPDGKRLASVAEDNHLKLWDSDTGALIPAFDFEARMTLSVAWSPDGGQIAVGEKSRNRIQLWDARNGRRLRVFLGHKDQIRFLAWSPDGKSLASASDDSTVKIWDTATGMELHTLFGHSSQVNSVAWSPDGTRLASGSTDGTVKIWNSLSGEQVGSFVKTVSGEGVTSVAWSPDGTRIASGDSGGNILIHDATPGFAAEVKAGAENQIPAPSAAK